MRAHPNIGGLPTLLVVYAMMEEAVGGEQQATVLFKENIFC